MSLKASKKHTIYGGPKLHPGQYVAVSDTRLARRVTVSERKSNTRLMTGSRIEVRGARTQENPPFSPLYKRGKEGDLGFFRHVEVADAESEGF